jgi:uncharacterized membrane protein
MADLVVVAYDGEDTADQVLNKLRQLQKEYLIDLEDAVVAVRDKNGKVRIKQSVPLVTMSAAGGAAWGGLFGLLIGLLFLNPLLGWLAGAAMGAGAGALSGALSDYGINDDFIKGLGNTIPKGSSALFILVKSSTPDKVLPEIEPYKPRVLRTSLSKQQEDKLRAALQTRAQAA